jgi:hypothetical protein
MARIRNNDNLPIPVGGGSSAYTYQEVGTDIDSLHPRIHDRQLSLDVTADMTNVIKTTDGSVAPVIRHIVWSSNVTVTLDKPTVVFISDNLSAAGRTELKLTATLIKSLSRSPSGRPGTPS